MAPWHTGLTDWSAVGSSAHADGATPDGKIGSGGLASEKCLGDTRPYVRSDRHLSSAFAVGVLRDDGHEGASVCDENRCQWCRGTRD